MVQELTGVLQLYMNKHYKNCSETGPFVSKLWELKYAHFPQIINI